ncbi:hypothetical protein MLD38_014839 [Melastoma candidum]|uniref:Uncharacterized protein n=1 Tax=Melastoma candidum TaxID=119954 RepID=A0ACB9RFF8_9MYRT|nr:hypothetical protein MLD38_014839 [Melastoma candidum]
MSVAVGSSPPQQATPFSSTLPGPPTRNNFGSIDLSPSGVLAFPAGSSITLVDSFSLQLISTASLPSPSSTSLSPFVTSLRFQPPTHPQILESPPPLLLAAGDRHGRIFLLDLRSPSSPPFLTFQCDAVSPKSGIQDMCWIGPSVVAAVSGPSLLSLFSASSARCFWKYDASPEYLSCTRRDPFDFRHFLVVGLRGFLLSVKVLGENEGEVVVREMQVRNDCSELLKLDKDSNGGSGPASAVYPSYGVRLAFSPRWKHLVYITFPRELVIYDLQYETALCAAALPRGCGKFVEVLPDPNKDFLYCVHSDGRLSIWKRKEGEQVHIMCFMEELMPSIGTIVPSPSVLAAVVCESNSILQNVAKTYSDAPDTPTSNGDIDDPFDFSDDSLLVSKTRLISISDDGKVWNWLLTAGGASESSDNWNNGDKVNNGVSKAALGNDTDSINTMVEGGVTELLQQSEKFTSLSNVSSKPSGIEDDIVFKMSLVGQLQLLSSAVTMLAVPSPSLIATLARGGNSPAVAVPFVALGTQSGTIDVIDVSANAVAASFSIHNNVVRGLRWLGNSRLVSFSYSQASEKTGGYTNKLVVTCLRSGLNKPFRVLKKPERSPIRALRASSSGRYLLILFRDSPVEVWAMTKSPIMLRSLALPFTVLEWTLPTVPKPFQIQKQSSLLSKNEVIAATVGMASPTASATADTKPGVADGSQDDASESFSFALVNGALGVFEVQGRRIRDFRPKWPSASFVSSDGLITAMAYRLPHVVMGDRSGSIRWWDVTTGHSSSFSTHREGIRRIKFSPVVPGDRSRGRIAVLFYDNTFSVYDLDSPDPLANSLIQPQFPGTLVVELDWLPVRIDKNDPLVLCLAGADSSFRLIEVKINDKGSGHAFQPRSVKEKFRPMPLYCPILLPLPHVLALRMILQLGVKPSWFNTSGDSVVPEMLLKVLELYRIEGCILDEERVRLYATVVTKGCVARFAFAAAVFGDSLEALFWLQLPRALNHLMNKLAKKPSSNASASSQTTDIDETAMLSRITSKGKPVTGSDKDPLHCIGQLKSMAFEQEELWSNASERILWHEKLEGEEAVQNRVHELVSVGNLEAAVSLLLSTPPESSYFYPNALRAVALSSAVSKSLHELAVKVVAANMVRTDRSLSGTHLMCAVGRYQEACSQLQDAGCWTDAATLAATHLKGSDYARVLQRWAGHILRAEHNIWRALILYVAAGALPEALAAIRDAHQPDTAAMFILACREIHATFLANSNDPSLEENPFKLPGLDPDSEEVIAVGEYYGQYQRKLVHLCMDSQPSFD